MDNEPAWRVVPGSSFRWRHWDDEFVLYHEQSGDTHRLNEVGARVVEGLLAGPRTAGDLVREVAPALEQDPGPQLVETIDRLLIRLHDLGLTERANQDESR